MNVKIFAATRKSDFTTIYFLVPDIIYNYLKKTNNEDLVYNFSLLYYTDKRNWNFYNNRVAKFLTDKDSYIFKEVTDMTDEINKIIRKFYSQLHKPFNKSFETLYKLFEKEWNPEVEVENTVMFEEENDLNVSILKINTNYYKCIIEDKDRVLINDLSKKWCRQIQEYELLFSDNYTNKILSLNYRLINGIKCAFLMARRDKSLSFNLNFLYMFAGMMRTSEILEKLEKAGK